MPGSGIYSVTVPGAVAGWDALRARFGTLPMSDLLAPAIFYAANGFPVTDVIAQGVGRLDAKLAADRQRGEDCSSSNGRAPDAGEMFKNPDLAGIAPADRAKKGRRVSTKARPPRRSSRCRASRAAR